MNSVLHHRKETLHDAQDAFQTNALDWQQVQWLNFGPVTYFMRYYAFEYWPDKKGVTQRQLRALAQGDPSVMDAPKFCVLQRVLRYAA